MNTCEKCGGGPGPAGARMLETSVERMHYGEMKKFPAMTPCNEAVHAPVPMIADPAVVKPARRGGKGKDWKASAEDWIVKHPDVIEIFLRLARAKVARDNRGFSIGALTEVVRWEYRDPQNPQKDIKINSNHRAYIGRHLIALDRSLEPFIELRVTRFD